MGDTVSDLQATAYVVPTDQPEADGTLEWDATTVVVAMVHAGGSSGVGWTYSSVGATDVIRRVLAPVVKGADPMDVPLLQEKMGRAVRNLGRTGIAAAAISAVDIALWDLKARLLAVPLARLFGQCRDRVPMYGSGGFTTYDDATTTAQLERWVEADGVAGVKIKVGEAWGGRTERDLHRVNLARQVIGPATELFVDANGAYTAHGAIRMGRRMVESGDISWLEEPVSSNDLSGLREVRRHLTVGHRGGGVWRSRVLFRTHARRRRGGLPPDRRHPLRRVHPVA